MQNKIIQTAYFQVTHCITLIFMYCKLIEETVKEIQGQKVDIQIEPEIDLMVKGHIPTDYIEILNQRLEIYRRIQLINELDECQSLNGELQDRYGAIPEPVEKLMELLEIRVLCQKLHISKVKLKGHQAYLTVEPETPVTPQTIASLVDKRLKFLSTNDAIVCGGTNNRGISAPSGLICTAS